jgi:hypothetical protein
MLGSWVRKRYVWVLHVGGEALRVHDVLFMGKCSVPFEDRL